MMREKDKRVLNTKNVLYKIFHFLTHWIRSRFYELFLSFVRFFFFLFYRIVLWIYLKSNLFFFLRVFFSLSLFFSWEPSGLCTHGCMSVCVLLEKYIPSCCVRNNKVKESSTSLGSLEMDIVKMSPLAAVLPEEEEGEEKEKEKKEKKKKERRKKMLTLIPSAARLCSFVFFLLFLS